MTTTEIYEVITHGKNKTAFGLALKDEETAKAYAQAMRKAGYETDELPALAPEPTLESALETASQFYGETIK